MNRLRRMSDSPFSVVTSSGDFRSPSDDGVHFAHHWTPDGVMVESDFTGAHLLHLAIAGCVLNDVHREARGLAVPLDGVRVTAWGDFDRDTWRSTGVEYRVEVHSSAEPDRIDELLRLVDEIAEIPKVLRAGATVRRV